MDVPNMVHGVWQGSVAHSDGGGPTARQRTRAAEVAAAHGSLELDGGMALSAVERLEKPEQHFG